MKKVMRVLLLLLPWTFFFIFIFRSILIWNDLPNTLAVHFNVSGEPDSWMGKGASILALSIGFCFLLLVFDLVTWILFKIETFQILRHIQVAIFYLLTFQLFLIYWQLLDFQIFNFPIDLNKGIQFSLLFAIVGLVFSFFSSKNNEADKIPNSPILFKEIHSSRTTALISIIIIIIPVVIVLLTPDIASKLIAFLIGIMIVYFAGIAINGFKYVFRKEGIEIRCMWNSLLFLPLGEINEFKAGICNPIHDFGGIGIRYTQKGRAFILGGRKVVQIKTINKGTIFLGHENPDKIIDHLKQITLNN